MKTFKHSGKIGDIIWSLPFIISNGGAEILYLQLNDEFKLENYNYIIPLLQSQSYIKHVAIYEGQKVDFDLDVFRKSMYTSHFGNLAESYFVSLNQTIDMDKLHLEPWLHTNNNNHGNYIIVTRTKNLHDRPIENPVYTQLINRNLNKKAIFIGLKEEHEIFCDVYNCKLPFVQVSNALETFNLVAGASMCIGNQTSTTTIAEALKKTMFLEVRTDIAKNDCMFNRSNLFYF